MLTVRNVILLFFTVFLLPLAAHAAWWAATDHGGPWNRADWSSARLLPAPQASSDASVRIYAARTGRWKGIFSLHCWIVLKEKGATGYVRYDKVGWGRPVRVNNWAPDAYWYGHDPQLVAQFSGRDAEAMIPRIKEAIARYPYAQAGDYRAWPGPNSNTFVAYVLSALPDANVALPPTAVGKDFRALSQAVGLTPSHTGLQVVLGGLLGLTIGWVEGLEVNILGLVVGLDVRSPALKVPGFGRLGLPAANPV